MKFFLSLIAVFFGFSVSNGNFAQAQTTKETVILDVRTQEEYNESHIKGAQQIDFLKSDFKDQVSKLDKSKSYKVYCRSGNRSGKAVELMKSLGFKDVENIGGLKEAAHRLKQPCEGKSAC